MDVGFAEEDITPELPCPIGGYGDNVAEGALGPPLFVRSIAVVGEEGVAPPLSSCPPASPEDKGLKPLASRAGPPAGGETRDKRPSTKSIAQAALSGVEGRSLSEWALSASDLIGLDREEMVLPVIEELRAKGYAGGVMLTASHTHSGPHTRFSQTYMRERADDAYLDRVRSALVSTILAARESARPAELAVGRTHIRENVNRRVNLADGSHHYLPHEKDLYPQATGPVDEELGVVAVRDARSQEPICTIVNYTAHALTIGNYGWVVSPDYPGVLAEELARLTGGPAMFTQGACGNVHPIGFENGPERMKELGASLAQAAYTVFRGLQYSSSVLVAYAEAPVELPTQERFMTDEKFRWSEHYRGLSARPGSVHAARLGDVLFVGVPGELFVEIGLSIKERSPAPYTYVLYNTNAYLSYIPTPEAYDEGGYEPNATLNAPESARIVEETSVALALEVWEAGEGS